MHLVCTLLKKVTLPLPAGFASGAAFAGFADAARPPNRAAVRSKASASENPCASTDERGGKSGPEASPTERDLLENFERGRCRRCSQEIAVFCSCTRAKRQNRSEKRRKTENKKKNEKGKNGKIPSGPIYTNPFRNSQKGPAPPPYPQPKMERLQKDRRLSTSDLQFLEKIPLARSLRELEIAGISLCNARQMVISSSPALSSYRSDLWEEPSVDQCQSRGKLVTNSQGPFVHTNFPENRALFPVI